MYLPQDSSPSLPPSSIGATLEDAYRAAQKQLWSPYLGLLVNSGLVTLLLSEVVKYFRTFRKDLPILKATVVALTIVELTQCCFAFYGGYVIFAKRWGRYPVWSQMLYGNMVPNALVASMTHAIYSHRLFHLCRRPCVGWLLAVTIGTLSLLQVVSCLVSVYWYAVMTHDGGVKQVLVARNFFRMWLVLCTVIDLIITAGMTVTLRASRTGLSVTDRLISRLLWILVPGGLATGLATFAALLIEVIANESDFYFFIIICLSKLYGVTVLVCLNHRKGRGDEEMVGMALEAKKKSVEVQKKADTTTSSSEEQETMEAESQLPSKVADPTDDEVSSPSGEHNPEPSRPRLRRLDSRSTFASSISTSISTPGMLPPQYTSGPSWISSSPQRRSPSRSPSAYRSLNTSPTSCVGTKPLLLCQSSWSLAAQAEVLNGDFPGNRSGPGESSTAMATSIAASHERRDCCPARLRSVELMERGASEAGAGYNDERERAAHEDAEGVVWMRGRNLPRGRSIERGRKG